MLCKLGHGPRLVSTFNSIMHGISSLYSRRLFFYKCTDLSESGIILTELDMIMSSCESYSPKVSAYLFSLFFKTLFTITEKQS